MSHTPGPWTVDRWADGQGGRGISIKDGDGLCIANMVGQLDDSEMKKARLIVLAVNAHKGLLEALRPFANYACELKGGETCDCHNCAARAAIAKAEGK
jgi:hypothetical protein